VRSQQVAFPGIFCHVGEVGLDRQVKRILLVPRRVILRRVESVEAKILGFHFGAVRHHETHAFEDAVYLLHDLGQGVQVSRWRIGTGQGGIDSIAQFGGLFPFLDGAEAGLEKFLQVFLGPVQQAADARLIFPGNLFYSTHGPGQGTMGTDVAGLECFEFGSGAQGRDSFLSLRNQGLECILHAMGRG